MPRRAHNSTFPEKLHFRGQIYSSPTDLYRSVSPSPAVSLQSFLLRLRKRAEAEGFTEQTIEESLYTGVGDYKRLYATRRSWVKVGNRRFTLDSFFRKEQSRSAVSYRTFWQRLRRFRADGLDADVLESALTLPTPDWISFYGGGRARKFTYIGEIVPEHFGRSFHSIASFLKTIGRYPDKALIWSRLKAGWELDDALAIPVETKTDREGLIYAITRTGSGQIYVGLTRSGIDQRWAFHILAARRGSRTKIAQAIREDGPEGFELRILEEGIRSPEDLKEREAHWAITLGAMEPDGLNIAQPGTLGSSRGVEIEWEGETFPSITEAAYVLGKRRGMAPHVIERRLRNGSAIPETARRHSKHPDAGSNLYRRWLALKSRHGRDIDPAWADDYDAFKADVGPEYHKHRKIIRKDDSMPWGRDNWRWASTTEMVEASHGQQVAINGIAYPSYTAAARQFGIGVSTLKNRILVQGLSPEDAVTMPLGKTSFRGLGGKIEVGGLSFRSKRQAILYLAKKHNLTEGQAKYKLERILRLEQSEFADGASAGQAEEIIIFVPRSDGDE